MPFVLRLLNVKSMSQPWRRYKKLRLAFPFFLTPRYSPTLLGCCKIILLCCLLSFAFPSCCSSLLGIWSQVSHWETNKSRVSVKYFWVLNLSLTESCILQWQLDSSASTGSFQECCSKSWNLDIFNQLNQCLKAQMSAWMHKENIIKSKMIETLPF